MLRVLAMVDVWIKGLKGGAGNIGYGVMCGCANHTCFLFEGTMRVLESVEDTQVSFLFEGKVRLLGNVKDRQVFSSCLILFIYTQRRIVRAFSGTYSWSVPLLIPVFIYAVSHAEYH